MSEKGLVYRVFSGLIETNQMNQINQTHDGLFI